MSTSSEKFLRIQQQFKECSQLEQLCAIVELTRSFQLSYQHFLIQLYQNHIQNGNDVMFNHTVDDANSADIVTCLLSNKLDKILFTLQLYLPLISTKTFNENLFNAYRDVLVYLDVNLSPKQFTYSEQQVMNLADSVCFFIQSNPNLYKLLPNIPKLIYLIQTKTFHPDEPQHYRQPLQRFASIRSQAPPLMVCWSEGSSNSSQISHQLTRRETNDSGVDLSEPLGTNLLSSHHQKHPFLERSFSSTAQKKHPFVGKTASSPIPEHATIDTPSRVPLKGVLSAPPPTTNHSDSQYRHSMYYQQKHVSSLPKSDEEDEESHQQNQDLISDQTHSADQSKPLGQFYSLRYRNIKNSNTEDVSQYLGVDANSAPVINTFTQPNTGMKDVPKWLKNLRLHKYDVFFSQMTYDEMMNLTSEQLKASHITDGACTKILLNVKKLKERSTLLKQLLTDVENGPIDFPNLIAQLNELMATPIRSKELAQENHSEEDLPKLIVEVLEKIFQELPSHALPDVYHSLLLLVDRCYRHEAFTEYAHLFLQWRRRLSNILQSLGKIDFRPNQATFSYSGQQHRLTKPSIRTMKSSSAIHYSNPGSTSVPISKYNSEPQNNFRESTLIRRPTKSPAQIYPTTEESNDQNLRTSIALSNHGAYLMNHQHQALTRKTSIDPQGESNTINKIKLCKTASDPHRIRFQNLPQSSIRSQQNVVQMMSTPYSQQQRLFISRSPPLSTPDTLTISPIKKCHSDNERSEYYGSLENATSFSNPLETENSDDQRQTNTELELFCRQITNKVLGDDVNDSPMDDKEESTDVSNTKQSLTNSIDMEQ